MVACCSDSPVDIVLLKKTIQNLDAVADSLFHETVSNETVGGDYATVVRERVARIQRSWELKNFRLMRMTFEKLQCDSYVAGRSVIGDALTGLIQCCDERDLVELNRKLTPFLKVIRSEMTATGLYHCTQFQAQQEKVTGTLHKGSPSVDLSTEPEKPTKIELKVQSEADGVVDPIYSSLPPEKDFQEIVLDFIPQMESKLQQMDDAIAKEDFEELGKLAHWLKGAGGTCGFNEMYDPSFELEQSALAKDGEACQMCLDLIVGIAQRIVVCGVTV